MTLNSELTRRKYVVGKDNQRWQILAVRGDSLILKRGNQEQIVPKTVLDPTPK